MKTYEDAVAWLESIGGSVRETAPDNNAVTASAAGLERTVMFSAEPDSPAREKERRRVAVRQACQQLRDAGVEQMVRGRAR